jgi:hypothetical protein
MAKIPGFKGYFESQTRRAADALLRETIVKEYRELWKRLTDMQADLASAGEIMVLDDLEKSATKLQTFMDKVETAARGYTGFFDAVKINAEALQKIYDFDLTLLESVEPISSAINNIESSIGSDGLPAAIRHLNFLTRGLVSTLEQRDEVVKSL